MQKWNEKKLTPLIMVLDEIDIISHNDVIMCGNVVTSSSILIRGGSVDVGEDMDVIRNDDDDVDDDDGRRWADAATTTRR